MVRFGTKKFVGDFYFEIQVSDELWYITNKDQDKIHHFLHFGYVKSTSPSKARTAKILVLSILWLNVKVGKLSNVRKSK